jgi:hypothetical protein
VEASMNFAPRARLFPFSRPFQAGEVNGLGRSEKSVVVILEGNEGKMPMPEVKAKDNG